MVEGMVGSAAGGEGGSGFIMVSEVTNKTVLAGMLACFARFACFRSCVLDFVQHEQPGVRQVSVMPIGAAFPMTMAIAIAMLAQ